ncbi:MAG: hypothetical protein AB7G11_16070 [Phycisphaerales bacterium]
MSPTAEIRAIASGGIRDTEDIGDLVSAAMCATLIDELDTKKANVAIRGATTLLRNVEVEHRYNNGESIVVSRNRKVRGMTGPVNVAVSVTPCAEDPLCRRERELREELAAIQKERAAR